MRFLKKFVKKLYHLIWFLSLYLLFLIPNVKANDMFGGTINQDISSPLRAMTDDSYGNYYIMPSNSAYLWYEPGPVSAHTMRVFCFEGQDYLQDHVYSVTIYLTTNTSNRVLPADSGTARRIGIGNSMNAARTAFVNNSAYARSVVYTNYSYDYFDIRWPKTDGSFGLQHYVYSVTYFFVPNISGVGLAVPFQFNSSVSSNTTIYYAGYHLEDLGFATNLSSSDIQNVISNSGLATARSVEEVKQGINEVKQELDNINDTLIDDTVSSSDDTISDLKDDLPTNSVISDILLLPIRLLQNIVNSLGGTCSSFNLGSLYGTNLVMPCIDIEHYVGSAIWTFIDLVFSGMFVLVIRKKFIEIWENITNLRNGGNEVD